MIIVNFKTYKESTGKKAAELAMKIKGKAIIAVQAVDIHHVKKYTNSKVYAQHVDGADQGKTTGAVTAEAVKEAGATGTLLNHAEKRMKMEELKLSIESCKKNKLKTVVCVPSIPIAKKVIGLRPDCMAFEDPKLIGTGRSVSTYNPSALRKFAKLLKGTRITPLCGAGISIGQDAKAAKELGMKGVLLASAVVKAKDPKRLVDDILKALK